MMGISVDEFTHTQRTIYYNGGSVTTDGASYSTWTSPWSNIDNYLGYNHEIKVELYIPEPDLKDYIQCGRSELTSRYPDERNRDFDGFENGLLLEEAIQEASRCLRCDCNNLGAFRGGRHTSW